MVGSADEKVADPDWRARLGLAVLSREERLALSERVKEAAALDADYVLMLALSAALASFGLLQGSTAVVIGAMVIAPLMGPLLAAGLALSQGNPKLFQQATFCTLIGVGLGFAVAVVVGAVNPGFENSLEIEARGKPDLFDLGIAFLSGMAGAWAQSRPKVLTSLAGVAIAAALVPPLAVVGLALSAGDLVVAGNAAILLATNLVGIALGAALVFHQRGAGSRDADSETRPWAVRATVLLSMALVLMAVPLLLNQLSERREGPRRPLGYPVSTKVRNAVRDYLAGVPSVEAVLLGRSSVEPEAGVMVILTSKGPIDPAVQAEVARRIRSVRGDDIAVRILPLLSAEQDGLGNFPAGGPIGGGHR